MKHPALALALAVAALAGVAACSDPVGDAPKATVTTPATPTAPTTPTTTPTPTPTPAAAGATRYSFTDDGTQSSASIQFVGAKVTGKHDGGFKKSQGTIDVTGDSAVVDVTIDMASIYTDTPKLTGHLQSAEFFDVAKMPTARFVSQPITRAADGSATVTGDLTLHGVTKTISFPAKVEVKGDEATAKAEFAINRKDFGVVYPGKPDDLIKDDVLLKLDVKAKKS